MSLTTDAGEATVKAACALFDVSRAAFYAARKAPVVALASTRSPGRPRGVPAHELLAGIRRVLDRQPGWGTGTSGRRCVARACVRAAAASGR